MNPVKQTHRKAMAFLDLAEMAGIKGSSSDIPALLLHAYEMERQAAEMVKDDFELEPTRSVLFSSAASLAKKCDLLREAEQLVCMGLVGNPPHEVAEELRDLFEEINYRRHLEVKGHVLSSSELQMSLAGAAIGIGMAQNNEALDRIQRLTTIIYRTAQRTRGDAFTSSVPRNLKKDFEIEISMPRAASFAVSFRMSHAPKKEQLTLPGMGWPEQVVDELMTCIDLLQGADKLKLRERFKEDAYLNNFLELSKLLAPDGERVSLVGLTAWQDGRERQVALKRSSENVEELTESIAPVPHRAQTTIEGVLLMADSTKPQKGELRVVDAENRKHRIVVKEGLGDIVRELYEERVRVTGLFDGKQIVDAVIRPIS
ncbi:MAG: hypothetical protein V1792_02995 [Pseudomonadota bacterium]